MITNKKYCSTIDEILDKQDYYEIVLVILMQLMTREKDILLCLPRITSQPLSVGQTFYKYMIIKFCNYVFMITLPDVCWKALKAMYDTYDNGFTFKSKKQQVTELALSIV